MHLNPMLEQHRVRNGPLGRSPVGAPYGAFKIPFPGAAGSMLIIADDGATTGWEHVSCSFANRTPTWDEMARVKGLFWDEEECVVQFHPAKSEYVNRHPHCLHLWKKRGENWQTPPKELVG